MSFASEEGSFLVGAAAALESKTGTVGYIGANASPLIEEFRAGFEQGAKFADPEIEVVSDADRTGQRGRLRRVPARRGGPSAGRADVHRGGCGRHLHRGGWLRPGAIEAATDLSDEIDRHLWAIGVDTDYLFELPESQRSHLLTSMVKRLDLGVEWDRGPIRGGTLEVPSTVRLGLAESGVGYSTSGDQMQASTVAMLRVLEGRIVSGEIIVDRTPAGPAIL